MALQEQRMDMPTVHPWLLAAALLLLVALPAGAAQPTSTKPGSDRVQTSAPTWDDWGKRAVYQIVTDRFAGPERMSSDRGTCTSLINYCGGTWQGMVDHLDYIQGLNLNAIWSSPVTAQSYGGYHGYWPVNLYDVNHAFGSTDDLQRVLQELSNAGMFNVLDMVLNHVGYGSSIFLPPFNPFSDPSNFNNCTNCDTNCNIPDDGPTFEQQWDCRLTGLPDLNHSVPFVRTQFEEWTQWMMAQYSAHLLRLDAAGNMHPDFFPWYVNTTDLVAWLEVGADVELLRQYEQVRDGAEYSYQGWSMAAAMNACFGLLPESFQPDIGCERLATLRQELVAMKVDKHNLGMWVENHDTDRFLTLRDSLPAYRNTLAHVLLSESIPIIYYGAEQSMNGSLSNSTNRSPLWETGFSTAGPMYRFIRTLAWYRWWMTLGWETFEVRFTDRRTFAFSRGNKLLVVLTNGNYSEAVPRPAEYRLSGLDGFAGARLCDALHSGFCVDVSGNGIASVTPSPDDEPLVLVRQSWVKDKDFFTPLEHRPVLWKQGLVVTFVTIAGAVLAWLLGLYALHCWHARCFNLLDDAATACQWVARSGLASFSSEGSQHGQARPLGTSNGKSSQMGSRTSSKVSLPATASLGTGIAGSNSGAEEPDLEEALAAAARQLKREQLARRVNAWRLESLGKRGHGMVHTLVNCLQNDPGMVMHIALEYAVPHMGLTGQLQYGGLGKVVETFICHTARPMLVCAPMYAPFYGPDGRLVRGLADSSPLLSMTAVVGSERHLVEIYATAAPAGTGAGSGGAAVNSSEGAQPAGPTVFFLLLDSDVFRNRTRGTIYQHASEDEELAFFSVFNQAVAHVVQTLGVASLQLHDYHGALSLLYLPHQLPLRVLLVAHNADYNGTWHLGTAAREAHVYGMLNVPINAHTRSLCEHSGRFNMLRPVLEHMRTVQGGLGVVAVSPRYALRAHSKFSMFWDLPHACVIGILNGMEDPLGEVAAAAAAADPDAFFARKAAARLAFQEAKGLQVGEDFRLLVFMGRITHQKGCDIIGLAARSILKQNRNAQLVMVGPIGDEYGEQAKHALEKVSADFPGRVWNGAGHYIMGADKEQLCMAADFFLCPSRFEPCGLADIEFGWLGAVQIGHNTGGLGKMPGFYYITELDCLEEQAARLASTALRALRAPPEQLRSKATEAMRAKFPPSRMVQLYDQHWARMHAVAAARAKAGGDGEDGMGENEALFYKEQWLEDNTPYNPKESKGRQAARRQRTLATWVHNLALVLMQAVMRVPSVLSLLWYSESSRAGAINFDSVATFQDIHASEVVIYFYCYAGSVLLFQLLGFFMPPLRYMRAAACINVIAVLLALWALWVPQSANIIYLINSATAATWVPMTCFIFLDLPRASVSQHGPPVMAYGDTLDHIMSIAPAWAILHSQGTINIAGMRAAGIVLLVLAVWFLLWLGHPASLSPHFRHARLRLRGQARLLLRRRRAWAVAVTITTADAFAGAFLASMVFRFETLENSSHFLLVAVITAVVTSALTGALLTMQPGRSAGLRLMYCLATIPAVTVVQGILIIYGGIPGLYVAAIVLAALLIRTNIVGLLNLHTLPNRETFTLVKTLQVVLGSLAIVAGLATGGSLINTNVQGLAVIGSYEFARLLLVAGFIMLHRRENIAKP